jgi:hypothetical protein
MLDKEPDALVEIGGDGRSNKKTWKRPEIIRASVEDTETGINVGAEILVLLSSS